MHTKKSVIWIVMAVAFAIITVPVLAGPIEDLQPGQWYEVPNSHLQSVAPTTDGVRVIDPWSGGSLDTKRDRLIVWGGGHGDYSGNEIYTFGLDSLKWRRENNPSNPPAVDVPYAPDGGPCARHTYDYIQYVASIDRFCSFGGAAFYQSGQTGTNHTDAFNFETKKWTVLADCPSNGIGAFSAYDPSTGHAWCHGTITETGTRLSEFDPIANTWTSRTGYNDDLRYNYNSTAAIDPINRKFIAIGKGKMLIWDISNPSKVLRQDQSGGPTIASPGFDYDSNAKKLVAWSSGQSVSVYDAAAKTWTNINGSGATPTAPAQWGTFGRFRYSPNKNVFVLVNSTTDNVFIYRYLAKAPARSASDKSLFAIENPSLAISQERAFVKITVLGINRVDELAVYTISGKRVAELSNRLSGGSALWHRSQGNGTYVVRASASGIRIVKRFIVDRQ